MSVVDRCAKPSKYLVDLHPSESHQQGQLLYQYAFWVSNVAQYGTSFNIFSESYILLSSSWGPLQVQCTTRTYHHLPFCLQDGQGWVLIYLRKLTTKTLNSL